MGHVILFSNVGINKNFREIFQTSQEEKIGKDIFQTSVHKIEERNGNAERYQFENQ